MRRFAQITGAILAALTISFGLVVGLGHIHPIRPYLIDCADQIIFACAATNLDCGYKPGYFTVVDPAAHTWRRAGAARPSLGQLVLTFGAPDGKLGDNVVLWKAQYALLSTPTTPQSAFDLNAPVEQLVLTQSQVPQPFHVREGQPSATDNNRWLPAAVPWTDSLAKTVSTQGVVTP